jgi:tetratricopeptide (TPR) repeat protein
MLYDWGYSSYADPYYVPSTVVAEQPITYDYSQPINPTAPAPSQSVTDQAISLFDQARDAFKAGNHTTALSLTDQALQLLPNDPALHEFRALVLFAEQRYDDAAASLYAVLSIGPGWDWPTLIGLYPDVDTYTRQLRALESSITGNPQSASARFVLAYHYLVAGHIDAALTQLQRVTQLQPKDTLSAQLLQQLRKATQPPPVAGGATIPAPAPAPVPAAPGVGPQGNALVPTSAREGQLVGDWTAQPSQDTTIALSFLDNNRFVWKVTRQGKPQQFQGDRTYGSGILTLAPTGDEAQPPMVGRVIWQDDNHFTFKIFGGPPDDPGLAFAKSS